MTERPDPLTVWPEDAPEREQTMTFACAQCYREASEPLFGGPSEHAPWCPKRTGADRRTLICPRCSGMGSGPALTLRPDTTNAALKGLWSQGLDWTATCMDCGGAGRVPAPSRWRRFRRWLRR